MNLRQRPKLEYKKFHTSGEKCYKDLGDIPDMDESTPIEVLKLSERKLRADINHQLEEYSVDDLDGVEDVIEGLSVITEAGQQFRHIHVELGTLLVEDYSTLYPDYVQFSQKLLTFSRDARKKIRYLKKIVKSVNAIDDKETAEEKNKDELRVKFSLLVTQITQLDESVDIDLITVEMLDEYLLKMNRYLEEYFDLDTKLRLAHGNGEYEELYSKYGHLSSEINQDMKMAKLLKNKLVKLIGQHQKEESDKLKSRTHVLSAESVFSEIQLRCESLESKYELDLKSLSDYQLLEVNQGKNLDQDFNAILEKVTSLASLVRLGGQPVETLLTQAVKLRDSLATKRKNFSDDLSKLVADRDVTPDKLKNATVLKIEIPKFSGYDSKMDLFTFKTEFQKLVEPTVQKKYWPDYLKRNYLSGSALTLVEKETEYTKIWEKLMESYGNARLLLQNKLGDLDKIGGLWKIRGDEKLTLAIAKLVNSMKELGSLATEHGIEGQLYEGGGLEKVMFLIGDQRHKKFRERNLVTMAKSVEWVKLLEFLQKEMKIRERLTLDNKNAQLMGVRRGESSPKDDGDKPIHGGSAHVMTGGDDKKCHICDKTGHTVIVTAKGNKIIPYYVCEKFVKMTHTERCSILDAKTFCKGCMFPGAVRGPKHKCFFTRYCCPHSSHTEKIHILLCQLHKTSPENVAIFSKFKEKFIDQSKAELPTWSKNLSLFSEMVALAQPGDLSKTYDFDCDPQIRESAIFQLQTIEIAGVKIRLFFDNGCGDSVLKKSAVDKLAAIGRAKQILKGPITITGVGDQKSVSEDGVFSVCLPLRDGNNALLTGICMPKITSKFPTYTLGAVEEDIRKTCQEVGGQGLVDKLPRLPSEVGGDTDILIGIKYLKYFPEQVFKLESGLAIYESAFRSACGTTGIVGGPHSKFSEIEKEMRGLHVGDTAYFTTPVLVCRSSWRLANSLPLLGFNLKPEPSKIDDPLCCSVLRETAWESVLNETSVESPVELPGSPELGAFVGKRRPPKCVKQFDEIEQAGTEVSYRCVDCRDCRKCKNSMRFDAVSIQEEVEQAMIERSIEVDLEENVTRAKLPFLVDPDTRLVPNEYDALRVFKRQAKMLNLKPRDKEAVIEFEKKLQDMGFVEYVSNLDDVIKAEIMSNVVKYFIPWRAVWNEKSVSTPCRMVFDGSMGSKHGCSLNSLLAKGAKSLNNLIQILNRWQFYKCAFHTDVTKMYNRIILEKAYWRYQLYLWDDDLAEDKKPVWKVIKTLIYGVRSSGNLAECGLRRTAELSKDEFPRAYEVVMYDTYMDDCISGEETLTKAKTVTDGLDASLGRGGYSLKGYTFSGESPPEHLSEDGESVLVAGMRWFPKGDFIKLNIHELNFNKKCRGRKAEKTEKGHGKGPETITKRDCATVTGEIFDPLGKVAPITAGLKLDVSELHQRGIDWDDPIPSELKNVWAANFDLIEEIGTLQFKRAIVPENACSLDIETIDTGDAGEDLVCASIYARFKLRDGGYSSQLIFSRTKIVHDLTIPRAELVAALLNVCTGHIVRLSLKELFKKSWKLTDSQVVLHWINTTKTRLKMFIRNRVIEITRLTERAEWWNVASGDNPADIGTRKGATIKDVDSDSVHANGKPWFRENEENFPLKSVEQIILAGKEKGEYDKECVVDVLASYNVQCFVKYVPNELGDRYKFSKYLVDPNRFRFRTVVRIMGMVFTFIIKCQRKCKAKRSFGFMKKRTFSGHLVEGYGHYVVGHPINVKPGTRVAVVHLSNDVLAAAKMYYFEKATAELQQFVDPSKYKNNSVLREGVLYHTGRILATQEVDGTFALSDACLDLSASSFCVPMTDALSPVAYAIVSETHWYHPDVNHGGVESVLRFSQMTAHIIGGRELVKNMKKACARCRVLHKKGVQVAMGPIADENLCIAPPFYYCQVDLCGPVNAYSPANKRATLKVWYAVFVCTTTSVVDSRIMEDYSADSFLQAFERFACRFGYPKMVLPDEGSQLVKGCENMIISFSDIQQRMSREYGIEFKTCPVGAHSVHGKVERKIQEIRRSIRKNVHNKRLSILQWETLGQQISNAINNIPIGIGNKTEMIENLDILTPNRLILGRNNNRCPTEPLRIENDFRRILESNSKIFEVWFKEWLISCVPSLVEKPKWFVTDRHTCVGDIVLFLKSDKEFDQQYQYGMVVSISASRDGKIRTVTVQYQNHGENVKRSTTRSVRDLVVIHPVEELGIMKELDDLAKTM